MCATDSSNDPIFFLHHGFIDKLWSDWQNIGVDFKNSSVHAENDTAMPGALGYTPVDVYDLQNQPGCVRVCLEHPVRPCSLKTTYSPLCPFNYYGYSLVKLAKLIPRPFPRVVQSAFRLFANSKRECDASIRLSDLLSNYTLLETVLRRSGYEEGKPGAFNRRGLQLNSVLFGDQG